ncbi:MAG: pyruvate:ferredoxin (flavodoxin) oxidoreductase [Oscillospiraceae bacterium]|nr:pyruvate:ferredoxin (flavodoxin) oxidoreductase [Oscillospiraceae bacterium]
MREFKTMDANTAAAHVAYAFSEVTAIYPITPSSPMAEHVDEWATQGRKNIFGKEVNVVELESEGGAAGALHGSLIAGAYTTTFTASQGLLLMIPNLFKIAAEGLPGVLHVAARTIATHALSIFGDHSDVMACRMTGMPLLASGTPQEVMDLAAVAHLSAIKGGLPMIHFFDGFRTSHEIQKLQIWDYQDLAEMTDWDAVARFRAGANTPGHPMMRGSSEAPETYFQHREASNLIYDRFVDVVADCMDQVNAKCGTDYRPFNYYGAPDATDVVVAMGSICGAIQETVDYLNATGHKTGLLMVRLYRPFSAARMMQELPETVQRISVLDRTKEPGALGEPLFLDVASAVASSRPNVKVIGGRYGLSSKDTTCDDMNAVFENLASAQPKDHFTVGIDDDVTHLSLVTKRLSVPRDASIAAVKFWGIGSDGLVGAGKNTIKIIGDHTSKYVQAYFQYDSKKSGGLTISHMRFSDKEIRSAYYVSAADFVACGNPAYIGKYDMVRDVKPGGIFLLNCAWDDAELEVRLPGKMKRQIAQNHIQFYTCNAVDIARRIGLKGRINTIIQSAYFALTKIIPIEDAVQYMEDGVRKDYGKKGENIVKMNIDAIHAGLDSAKLVSVPASWASAEEEAVAVVAHKALNKEQEEFVRDIVEPVNRLEGDFLPVSKFLKTVNGQLPSGTSAFEKRGIAVEVPAWTAESCIQCNWCSIVCPHGVIRPFTLSEKAAAASGAETADMKGQPGKKFLMAISAADCTGCGSCEEMCPAHNKAIQMVRAETCMEQEQRVFDWALENHENQGGDENVKQSQFLRPYLEYSGACPGCGETPYAKLVTQLFGKRAIIANATGCSSIWGCSAPITPYTVDENGNGPAWANSLFEDNAEFGYGMAISMRTRRAELKMAVERLAAQKDYAAAANEWLAKMDTAEAETAGAKLLRICKRHPAQTDAAYVAANADLIGKPSMWIFGGDGWAYDIGYGGLDHVLASRENVNVLVFDTEVYSNTGGQSSKSTPTGAVAQFASNGKVVGKKDLAQIAMTYGYVYVAQIAMGANPAQALKAIVEAESYDGPSLIICYAPCINHGIKAGMNRAMPEMKRAVRAGYWNLLRFDPRKTLAGENPLQVDSAKPNEKYGEFLKGEVRYSSLVLKNPQRAEKLFDEAEHHALGRYDELLGRQASLEPKE